MSKAREIIEERLAKGEISEEEFDTLISKIRVDGEKNIVSNNQGIDETSTLEQSQPQENNFKYIKYGVIAAGVFLLVTGFLRYEKGLDFCPPEMSPSVCSCAQNAIRSQTSFLMEVPIFGSLFIPKNDDISQRALKQCIK